MTPALTTWIATRLAYLALTYVYPLVSGGETPSRAPVSLSMLFNHWIQWDSVWYVHIARFGYTATVDTAFFPLFPGVIRLIALTIGPHWTAAALLASNLSALLAFIGVAALAAQIAPPGAEAMRSRMAVTVFAAYPLAFFLFAPYSDGLFAGSAALALFFGMRRRWWWAALFGLLAALCRPIGPALILPLAWETFQHYRTLRESAPIRRAVRGIAPALPAIVAPLVGLGIYCMFLWLRFGDPLIFIQAESTWRHISLSPLLSVPLALLAFARAPLLSAYQTRIELDLVPTMVAIVLTLVAARRAPVSWTLYLLAVLYIITSEPVLLTDFFLSAGRYLLAAIPLFALAGGWLRRSEWLLQAMCWSGALVQGVLAIFFLRHGFIV